MSKETDIRKADEIDIVSGQTTGLQKLDIMSGIGGLPVGRIIVLTGEYSSGKTALTLQLISEAQKAGYRCLFADAERTFHKGQAVACGVDLKKLEVLRASHGEKMLDDIEKYVFEKKPSFVVLDSYSQLSPRTEMEADNERKGMMEKSRMMAPFMRRMVNYLGDTQSILVIIAHDYLTVLPGGRQKNVMAGGDTMVKLPSIWWKLYARPLLEGANRVGSTVTIRQKKNKVGGVQDADCELRYLFAHGFEKVADPIEAGLADGSIVKKQNTYWRGEERLGTISRAREILNQI